MYRNCSTTLRAAPRRPDWQYEEIVIDKRSFNKDRDYLWPIPLKELNANPLIRDDQNPGY